MNTFAAWPLVAVLLDVPAAQLETSWPSCTSQVQIGAYQVCVRAVAWAAAAECSSPLAAAEGACLAVRLTVRKTARDQGCSRVAVRVGVDPTKPPEPPCVFGGWDIRWLFGEIRTIDYRFSLPARRPAASLVLLSNTWGSCRSGLRFGLPTPEAVEIPLENLDRRSESP
jgi:hypothetical protein